VVPAIFSRFHDAGALDSRQAAVGSKFLGSFHARAHFRFNLRRKRTIKQKDILKTIYLV
jgi:hypothetical protein